MKREPSLYPLSHDHHHGLVQASRLKNAGKPSSERTIKTIASEFIEFWYSDLIRHFREEEDYLLPVLLQYSSDHNVLISKTILEHIDIRRSVLQLEEDLWRNIEIHLDNLHNIGKMLESHIRFEERELFPLIEEKVPSEELESINKIITSKMVG
ncbi:MAG: hemerythrin domain-containing protein [Syntrophothermus sp.]